MNNITWAMDAGIDINHRGDRGKGVTSNARADRKDGWVRYYYGRDRGTEAEKER